MSMRTENVPLSGLLLSATAGLVGLMIGGAAAALAAAGFGLLATGIQLVARRLMAGQGQAPLTQFMKRWGAGMGLRLLGVVLVAVVIWLEPRALPPVPAALGYVGVLVPLLFLEAKRI
jgi:hypothetical protein